MGSLSRLEKIPNRDGRPVYKEVDGHLVKLTRRGEGSLVSDVDVEKEGRYVHPAEIKRRRKKNKKARQDRRKNR